MEMDEDEISQNDTSHESGSISEEMRSIEKYSLQNLSNFLLNHQEVTNDNILKLNQAMQKMLNEIINKLVMLYKNCEEKYRYNEILLTQHTKEKQFLIKSHRCINLATPHFINQNDFSVIETEDYLHRKSSLKEFFPIDLLRNRQSLWTVEDAVSIIFGVRKQVITFLNSNKKIIQQIENRIGEYPQTLKDLLNYAGTNFIINWGIISLEDINLRHSEKACRVMWNEFLNPSLNQNEWTEKENKILIETAQRFKYENWAKIAEYLKARSSKQCFVQYRILVEIKTKTKKWTPRDDNLLIETVNNYSVGSYINWGKVREFFPDVKRTQIYNRYIYSLHPRLKKTPFTVEEDRMIFDALAQYGENFRAIPRSLFPHRSAVQIRNRYFNTLKPSQNQRFWTAEDDTLLLELVNKFGTSKWSEIANKMKGHSRTSCRTRYTIISNFFLKFPEKTIQDLPRKRKRSRTNHLDIEGRKQDTTKELTKSCYFQKLRKVSFEYYSVFKYSYGYELPGNKILNYNLDVLRYLGYYLCCKIPNSKISKLSSYFEHYEVKVLESYANNYLVFNEKQDLDVFVANKRFLPVNLSTILGLRGIAIKFHDLNLTPRVKTYGKGSRSLELAKRKFRNRFLLLFYYTALFCKRGKPNDVFGDQNIDVLETENPQIVNSELSFQIVETVNKKQKTC